MIAVRVLWFLSLALWVPVSGEEITGKVVSVADGDTVTLLTEANEQVKVRLEAIDAPEKKQAFGTKSREALATIVAGKQVTVDVTGRDRYRRTLGWMILDGKNINRRMVAAGWAWQFIRYNQDPSIARLQESAKKARRGLWADSSAPIPPWEYRKLPKEKR